MEQSNQYYPFGMLFAESTNPQLQDYKYNGKELDRMHGLDMYDYSARYYNSTVPMFTTADPHLENYYSWSPYVYVANNPMKYIDPTGMDWYKNEDGTAYMWRRGNDESFTHTIGEGDNKISMQMTRIGEMYTEYLSDGSMAMWNQQNLETLVEPQVLSQKESSLMEKWSSSDNFFASLSYNVANDLYVTLQPLTFELITGGGRTNEFTGEHAFVNLDGSTNYNASNSLIGTISLAIPYARSTGSVPRGLGYVGKLNAAQFSHTFKGSLSTFSPTTRGTLNKTLNKGINSYNNQIPSGMIVFKVKGLAPKEK